MISIEGMRKIPQMKIIKRNPILRLRTRKVP